MRLSMQLSQRQPALRSRSTVDHIADTVFVPTIDQVLQSQRNEQESIAQARAAAADNQGAGSTRSAAAVAAVRSSSPPRERFSMLVHMAGRSQTLGNLPPRPATWAEDRRLALEDQARAIRRLGPKHHFSDVDQLRLDQANQRRQRTLSSSTPGVAVVSSRHEGSLSVVQEHHGFCYETPTIVQIATYPVMPHDEPRDVIAPADSVRVAPKRHSFLGNDSTAVKTSGKQKFSDAKAKVAMRASAAANSPFVLVPERCLLKIRITSFLAMANTGDLLLEGGWYGTKSQYIQQQTKSAVSHCGIIYRDRHDGTLYLLTSRKWSKRFNGEVARHVADFGTSKRIDGVQMHPLIPYLDRQIRHGQYFVHRKLLHGRRNLAPEERELLSDGLMSWYDFYRGFQPPTASDTYRRVKAHKRLREGKSVDDVCGGSVVESTAMSASQTCIEALQHAGVISKRLARGGVVVSCPAFFESTRLVTVDRWSYDPPFLIHGVVDKVVEQHARSSDPFARLGYGGGF